MGMVWGLFLFLCGLLLGHLIPRIPMIIITRMRSFNRRYPNHPRPVPVDGYLLQRVLQMRMMRRWGILFTSIPLLFGWMMLKWSVAAFGMGLFLAGGWTLLSWILPLSPGISASPWTMHVAQQLQIVRNKCDSADACCESSMPQWELTGVRCGVCRKTLLNIPRPDLGRPRSDGKIMGMLRLWISDGGPLMLGEEE